MVLYEVRIQINIDDIAAAELIRTAIVDLGIDATEVVESQLAKARKLSFYVKSPSKARSAKRKLQKLKHIKVSINTLKSSDWQNRWKDEIKPFKLTKSFHVIPYWCKDKLKKIFPKDIIIDTENVFGLGTHPTTQITAKLIESKRNRFKDFLDIGTGTGILSVIASKCGAYSIWAVDATRQSIKIAKKNFLLNSIKPSFLKSVDFAKADINKKFNMVAANIVTDELIRLKKKIINSVKTGGYLAISGISAVNYIRFKRAFNSKRLKCLKMIKQQGWYGFLYKKV